jgi:hypothetical protein
MTRNLSFSADSEFSAWRCLPFAAALFLCAVTSMVCRADAVPDWLAAANRIVLGHFGEGSAAVVVDQSKDFTVDATGKFILTERRAIRVLDRRSAEPYLRVAGLEDSNSSVISIRTWSIAVSGRVVESGKKDVTTAAEYAGFELFSDLREKIIQAPGADEGSLVGFEVVRQGRIPISGEMFALEDEIPIRQGKLHVSVPSGSLRWFVNHPDRVEVVSQSPNSATFRAVDRPGIPHEQHAPPFSSLAAEVVVNYDPNGNSAVKSWEEAGRLYHPLFSNAEKPGTEIASEVERLSAGKSDGISKLEALYTFVSRQIRYVAIEIGIGGYQPHPASDVYKYKYGDCKDKASLLLTMLDHIGLRGYPALVGTRGDIEADPGVPTLATFDHMIVALPVPADLRAAVERFPAYDRQNQILWLDPTSESDPLGQLPEMDQGVFALISYPDHGDLRGIPEAPPEQNGVEYDAHLRLQSDGSGTAEVEVKYLGASNASLHYFYRGRSQSEIRSMFEERVARYVTQAAFREASVSGMENNSQQIVERFSFTGDFAIASSGDSWFFQPLFLSGMAVPEVGPRPRLLPLDIGTPYRLKGEYRVELPPGMRMDSLPKKTSIRSAFGEVEVEYSLDANILLATKTISFTLSRIPPENYADFRDFVNAFLRVDRQRFRVVKIVP